MTCDVEFASSVAKVLNPTTVVLRVSYGTKNRHLNFGIFERNPIVLPFKLNVFNTTVTHTNYL